VHNCQHWCLDWNSLVRSKYVEIRNYYSTHFLSFFGLYLKLSKIFEYSNILLTSNLKKRTFYIIGERYFIQNLLNYKVVYFELLIIILTLKLIYDFFIVSLSHDFLQW
jgi:hypothetical protein